MVSWRRVAGLASLLGSMTWLVVIPIWTYSASGGIVDRTIGALLDVPYRAGKHLAHVLFPDVSVPNAKAYYAAPLLGAAAEILLFMALWGAILAMFRLSRGEKARGRTPPS
ncbi:MAG: hypothetical protein JOZ36_11235 [Acidobacteria bacterium]|nr:hypothetical protein [Acidobacteriota bacterium]